MVSELIPSGPPSARSYLASVLGDLVGLDGPPVWNAAVVEVLELVGIEPGATRQALSRAAARGFVAGSRSGRSTRWSLTARGRAFIETGFARLAEFEAGPPAWDGRWLVLFAPLPSADRTTRRRLYARLAQLRLGNPAPGMWVTPWSATAESLPDLLAEYGLEGTSLLFVDAANRAFLDDPALAARSWDLAALEARYRGALTRFSRSEPTEPRDVLADFVAMRTEVQTLMWSDPGLPTVLTPGWVGRDFATVTHERYLEWSGPARAAWAAILQRHRPATG